MQLGMWRSAVSCCRPLGRHHWDNHVTHQLSTIAAPHFGNSRTARSSLRAPSVVGQPYAFLMKARRALPPGNF
jgi:hypothetical protein